MRLVEAYRQLVVVRAGGACEYCRLLQAAWRSREGTAKANVSPPSRIT
jgi:hypothetical protein